MSNKITFDQKETIIEALRSGYTKDGAAKIVGVTHRTINNEERRSLVFARRVKEATEEGKGTIGDIAIERIKWLASEENKDVRSRLTANAMLANWTVPGFRGVQETRSKIDHDVRIISAVPRPKYAVEVLDNLPQKMLKSGKRTKKIAIRDEQGNYIGTQTVEEAIEGEVINE